MDEAKGWGPEDTEAVMEEWRREYDMVEARERRRQEAIADGLDPELVEEMWELLMSASETIEALHDYLDMRASGAVSREDAEMGSARRTRPALRRVVRAALERRATREGPAPV